MKKVLSVMLAIMMLFGALSVTASASNAALINQWTNSDYVTYGTQTFTKSDYIIAEFEFNGGTSYKSVPIYNVTETAFELNKATGAYLALPGNGVFTLTPGSYLTMPLVTPAEGDAFQGWHCYETGEIIAGGAGWLIPEGSGGSVYHFTAWYYPAEGEEDTLKTILGVLMKVFGTIVGVLFLDGSSAAGIELMEKMLGGLLG